MARVVLEVMDPANRLTLKAMLEAEGHETVETDAEVTICDEANRAVELARIGTVLLLCGMADVREAVAAMKQGVHGYILLPFVAGEAGLMVQRALNRPSPADDERIATLDEVELAHIRYAVRRCRGNQAEAARVLGIGRNTLWRKLKKSEDPPISKPDPDEAAPP